MTGRTNASSAKERYITGEVTVLHNADVRNAFTVTGVTFDPKKIMVGLIGSANDTTKYRILATAWTDMEPSFPGRAYLRKADTRRICRTAGIYARMAAQTASPFPPPGCRAGGYGVKLW